MKFYQNSTNSFHLWPPVAQFSKKNSIKISASTGQIVIQFQVIRTRLKFKIQFFLGAGIFHSFFFVCVCVRLSASLQCHKSFFFFPPKFYCRQRSTDRKQYETLGSTHRFRCKKKITRGGKEMLPHFLCAGLCTSPTNFFFFSSIRPFPPRVLCQSFTSFFFLLVQPACQ